ncbi:MAG: hypothetical protein U5L03_11965 [Burkholderiaceae bacterium]|nr:hypothetical protein [Burkholderiaceae bacterium]
MHPVAFALLGVLMVPIAATAQALAPGKYSGRMEYVETSGKTVSDLTTLTIEKIDGDRVQGTAYIGFQSCREDVPFSGRIVGDKLTVGAKHSKEMCSFHWDLTVSGNKLEGKSRSGKVAVRLSR